VPGLRAPQGGWSIGLVGLVVIAGAVAIWRRGPRPGAGPRFTTLRRRGVVLVGVAAAAVMLLAVGGTVTPGRHELGVGAEVIAGGGRAVLVVDGRAAPGPVVGGLRRLGVRRVDVVLARTSSDGVAALAALVADRFGPSEVVTPAVLAPGRAGALEGRWETVVGEFAVGATSDGTDRLAVVVRGPEAAGRPE